MREGTVGRTHIGKPWLTPARIEILGVFLVIGALSLALGVGVRSDRHALLGALAAATAGVALVVPVWSRRRRSRWPRANSASEHPAGLRTALRPYLVPRELPPGPTDFVGRNEELAALEKAIRLPRDVQPVTVAICGPPGIGKSALAITVAHKMAPLFPDGQLFVPMRGARESDEMTNDDLVEYFVTALKGPADSLPSNPDALREEFAELTHDRLALFVLDDVPLGLDITNLRPPSPGSAFIVTCRDRPQWPEEDCMFLDLKALHVDDALAMLRTSIGPERADKEMQSSLDLVSLCGRQPHALRAAGTAVANRPDWELRLILELARSTPGERAPDRSRDSHFDAAYAMLTADERQALRVLGVLDETDFAPWKLAAALNTDEARGSRLASRLADAGLIERYSPGSGTPSYRAEEPVLRYAQLRANAVEGDTESPRIRQLIEEAQDLGDEGLADEKIATLDELLEIHGGFTPAIDKIRTAISRARERGSLVGEAEASAALAELYAELGDMVAAQDLAQRALKLGSRAAEATADPAARMVVDHSQARALRCLVRTERRRHQLASAAQLADRAMDHAQQADDRPEQVHILLEKAVVMALHGESREADRLSREALETCGELGRAGDSLLPNAYWCRGSVLLHAHLPDDAAAALKVGKAAADRLGQTRMGAWIDQVSARAAFAVHNRGGADEHATNGLDAFTSIRHRYGTAHCRYLLGQVFNARGDTDEAIRSLREALETFRNCGDMWIECEVALELSRAYRRQGRMQDAIRLQRLARRMYRQMDGHAQARQATRELARTLVTAPLPHRFRGLIGTPIHLGRI
jgi:tetratricopeptide (TPR) repeat protein